MYFDVIQIYAMNFYCAFNSIYLIIHFFLITGRKKTVQRPGVSARGVRLTPKVSYRKQNSYPIITDCFDGMAG